MKTWIISLTLLSIMCILSSIVECRKHKRRREEPLVSTEIEYLNAGRVNKNTPVEKGSVNLKLVKGVIHTFLGKLGMPLKEVDKCLKVPIKQLGVLMRHFRKLINGESQPESVKAMGELFSAECKTFEGLVGNIAKVKEAIEAVKPFIHPTHVSDGKKTDPENRRRIRRYR